MQWSEISVAIKNTICFPFSEETFAVATNTSSKGVRWLCRKYSLGRQEFEIVAKFMQKYIYYGPLVAI
jgi:hypothetical protein